MADVLGFENALSDHRYDESELMSVKTSLSLSLRSRIEVLSNTSSNSTYFCSYDTGTTRKQAGSFSERCDIDHRDVVQSLVTAGLLVL